MTCSLCHGDSMTSSATGNRDLMDKVPVPVDNAGVGSIVQYVNNMKDRTINAIPTTFKRVRVNLKLLDEELQPLALASTGTARGTVQVELRTFYD